MIENLKDEYIHGDKFLPLADYIFTENKKDYTSEILQKNCILFCHTHFLNELFEYIKFSTKKYILISHNSDNGIDEYIYSKKPKCITKWYAQNVLIDRPNLIPIPIGMERPNMYSSGDINLLINQLNKEKLYSNIALMNFSISTNIKERSKAVHQFNNKKWVTHITEKTSFKDYIENVHSHLFVISPPGNGIDCIRTWESIYLDTIPIVKKSVIFDSFNDLPIIQIENWEEINESFLWEQYYNLKFSNLNYKKATISYWLNIIKNDKKEILNAHQ